MVNNGTSGTMEHTMEQCKCIKNKELCRLFHLFHFFICVIYKNNKKRERIERQARGNKVTH